MEAVTDATDAHHHDHPRDGRRWCGRSTLGAVTPLVELKPLPVTRVANALPGALLVALGLWAVLVDGGSWIFGGVVAVLGVGLAFRGYRLGVTVTERGVEIRGFLFKRVIPREAVAGFTDWPAVVWRSELGLQHSRMVAFRTNSHALRSIREHNAACVAALMRTAPPRPES
jgi:hypothetical protein